jgi:Ner family transcriptional regulator
MFPSRIKALRNAKVKEDIHPAFIVAQLRIAGWSLRKLSRHSGLALTTISNALRRPYPRAERIIADAIGCRPEEIWPSRYAERAQRKTSTQRRRA